MSFSQINEQDTFSQLELNEEFVLAFNAMEGQEHMFITGKAGTGKSTLLQYFRHKTRKRIAVLAPTGVAALNVKGQTIHSFFQFRPDITPETVGDILMRRQKRDMFRKLQTVIIDEVSMVRADLLDCIDTFLRIYGPDPAKPFGGVQMIFFGDLYQLPPVVGRQDGDIFRTVWPTPYFFSAHVFESIHLKTVELRKIYRQTDERFIHLLNAIRHNNISRTELLELNQRVKPTFRPADDDFFISLTTTNAISDTINQSYLSRLPGKAATYAGDVHGEFDKRALPTAEQLTLKIGAQIMMLNNDPEKRWVNGSLGKIMAIEPSSAGDTLMVELANGEVVDVRPYTWEISRFYYNEELEMLDSQVVGYFTHYPLKLAWAVTIHKSQGQTFQRVIIDIGRGTFSPGQMYVALSRCTTLEGIVLKQPIALRHLMTDTSIAAFMQTVGVPRCDSRDDPRDNDECS